MIFVSSESLCSNVSLCDRSLLRGGGFTSKEEGSLLRVFRFTSKVSINARIRDLNVCIN